MHTRGRALLTFAVVFAFVYTVNASSGIKFQEVMQGYWTSGDLDYQTAYDQGKVANRPFHFDLDVIIPDMDNFLSDKNHSTLVQGTITLSNGMTGTIINGSYVRLFDSEVQNYTMHMHYFLVFTYQGKVYHLDGVKNILGNDCVHLLPMMTTLYSRIRTGDQVGTGDIIATGIVIIDGQNLSNFVFSFRGYNTNFFGFFYNVEKLLQFALKQIKDDCLHMDAYKNQFWYIWSSTGASSFLLDVIKRPSVGELRLDLYQQGTTPSVIKQFPSLSTFKQHDDIVVLGNITLSQTSCQGSVEQDITLEYDLTTDHMEFTPKWLESLTRGLLPKVVSRYGSVNHGTVNKVSYANLPITYTTYTIPIGLSLWRWSMISAPKFENTDLMIESMSLYLGGQWIPSVFIRYKTSTYRLNNPILMETKVIGSGDHVIENKRNFSISIHKMLGLQIALECSAPESSFALLEQEGITSIHTSVLGECTAHDLLNNDKFTASGALLEVKY